VCDNHNIGVVLPCAHPRPYNTSIAGLGALQMVEELEQEYLALKDKVRDLREYL
jgi:hypothetical protein